MLKELQYPFDAPGLLKRKKRIKKQLLESGGPFLEKRIAVLGGSTTDDIVKILELFLLDLGIEPSFYESGYGQYYQDAMFPDGQLEGFHPDIIYICTSNRNITGYPSLSDDTKAIDRMLQSEIARFSGMWERLEERFHCPIIQNNLEMPLYRLLGNKDVSDIHGATNFINRLNMGFYQYAQSHQNFHICDINYLSADYGLKEWQDPFFWYMYKYALNVSAIPHLAHNVANIIKSIFGKNKKGFVLDLDNTLWGGVIGDDGVEDIALGPEVAKGQVFSEFQAYIKAHKQLGVLLNINSKNDEDNALAGLRHPDSRLAPEDFIVIKANWDPKDQNLLAISSGLDLLPESLVFIDDNPAERHIVSERFPGVAVPELGQPYHYIQDIDRGGYFEVTSFTADDSKRNEMYRQNLERADMQARFIDHGDFLRSLGMRAEIRPFSPMYMSRIAQLTNKTNQFNLTTERYTQTEIERISADQGYLTLYGKLEDRFGDNGVVTVVIGRIEGGACHIDLWLMSCRVLKRDMEYAMMDRIVEECLSRGLKKIYGYYRPTAKNNMVRDLYHDQGFTKISEDECGGTVWILEIPERYEKKNKVIQIKEIR